MHEVGMNVASSDTHGTTFKPSSILETFGAYICMLTNAMLIFLWKEV
jgi:hypothetical protein